MVNAIKTVDGGSQYRYPGGQKLKWGHVTYACRFKAFSLPGQFALWRETENRTLPNLLPETFASWNSLPRVKMTRELSLPVSP